MSRVGRHHPSSPYSFDTLTSQNRSCHFSHFLRKNFIMLYWLIHSRYYLKQLLFQRELHIKTKIMVILAPLSTTSCRLFQVGTIRSLSSSSIETVTTERMNLFTAINNALFIALKTDPSSIVFGQGRQMRMRCMLIDCFLPFSSYRLFGLYRSN